MNLIIRTFVCLFKLLITLSFLQTSVFAQAIQDKADTTKIPQNNVQPIEVELITEINHPYVFYKNESKELTGIAYEMAIEMLNRANIKANITVKPWLRAIRYIQNNDNSCLFIMNRTAEREASYQWIGPMVLGHLALYKRPDSPIIINQLSDIEQYKVIGKLDGLALKDLQAHIDIQPIHTSSDEQSAMLLYRGRGDLWTTGDIDGPMAANQLGYVKPVQVLQRGGTILSMGCSVNLSSSTFNKLTISHNSMEEFRKRVIEKYLTTPQK